MIAGTVSPRISFLRCLTLVLPLPKLRYLTLDQRDPHIARSKYYILVQWEFYAEMLSYSSQLCGWEGGSWSLLRVLPMMDEVASRAAAEELDGRRLG